MDLLKGLNEEQRKAVLQTEGPVLILAGAGSGKTKALTHRIAYLLSEKKVSSENILAVTFTNKAANEIKTRVAKLINDSKSRMPLMGTFHSICVRILRKEIGILGYKSSFTIYDESDAIAVIKKVMKEMEIDPKKYNPKTIKHYMSGVKNELMGPRQYEKVASGYIQDIVSDVYYKYEELLHKSQALDFDDLIMKCVEVFLKEPKTLEKYQNIFKYILIDEYQDTNHAQYTWANMLAQKNKNIFVIGDDWQCLIKGTKITTSEGIKSIEDIKKGDLVRSGSGYGGTHYFKTLGVKKFKYDAEVVQIKTAGGKKLTCTPNHILFAKLNNDNCHFVYLMYSIGKGYRIGVAKGTRFDGKRDDVGLRVRANQERADRMWIIKVCDSKEDANYYENYYSYEYGIPMLVFHSYKNREMKMSQKVIDELFDNINTVDRANKLMGELGINFDYPHFIPQATVRNGIKRLNINLILFGDKRKTKASPWAPSRLFINTTNKTDLRSFDAFGHSIRKARSGTFKVEMSNLDYGKLENSLSDMIDGVDLNKVNVCKYSFLTDQKFLFMPASQIHKGMSIPISNGEEVIEDKVVGVENKKYKGNVYDLDIDKVHNYIANGVVVHNSIYSWRGANFKNILDFEHDYPDVCVIKLEQNYRSTQNILEAAHSIIEKNEQRSKKELWTEKEGGEKIKVFEAMDDREEARHVADRIEEKFNNDKLKLKDVVILYRTNAQSRVFEEIFMRYNMPYKIVGGVRFYERKEVKDILAYLKFVSSGTDMVSFDRVVNMPSRGIGKGSHEKFDQYVKDKNMNISEALESTDSIDGLTTKARNGFEEFRKIIRDTREKKEVLGLVDFIDYVMKRSGYLKYLTTLDDKIGEGIEGEIRKENLGELLSVAEEFGKGRIGYSLEDFLEEVALVSDMDKYSTDSDAVTLMTVHSAKGLEFEHVFIVGLEEDIFPHSRSNLDPSEMEEERRLMYVAITRAKREASLIYAKKRMHFGSPKYNLPSRFIDEISLDLVDRVGTTAKFADEDPFEESISLNVGDKIFHEILGKGEVLSVDDDIIEVDFPFIGKKTLSISYAPIKKL